MTDSATFRDGNTLPRTPPDVFSSKESGDGAEEDTIAAIATAPGEAGIAIVRISGPKAGALALARFTPFSGTKETISPRTFRLGVFQDGAGQPLDQVLFVLFAAPRSYTGEEVAELHCHGGTLAARLVLAELFALGARPAEPGEFTRRAFLNGRIDLAQAEAVLSVIRARSDAALRAGVRTLQGNFSSRLKPLYDRLLHFSSLLEASLDFPEEDLPEYATEDVHRELSALSEDLSRIYEGSRQGNLLREGVRVALVGRPNVGKSSLLNAFLQESRAIVTSIPGTTRDIIEEVLTHKGVPLRLLDTAGIRTPEGPVEALGIDRANRAFEEADIRIWVVDGSQPLTREDEEFSFRLAPRPHLVAINKADLPLKTGPEEIRALLRESMIFVVSAERGEGLEEVKDALVRIWGNEASEEEAHNVSSRQVEELRLALDALAAAEKALAFGLGQDAAATALAEARGCLERILGLSWDDALLDAIFSRFCIGK
jgi:tRNA modification GTPase